MSNNKKKVLIADDHKRFREGLLDHLDQSRFEVYTAENEQQMRQQAEAHWEDLDVIVLDNELNPDDQSITGPGIAIEYREKKRSFPPESIVFSKFDDIIDYYRLAIQLGATAYLGKHDLSIVADHVKVLALRRALNPANPKLVGRLARIATRSKDESDAILAFCEDVLKVELDSCLGVPFLVLFSQGNNTRNCASNVDLPIESPVYQELQDVANANLSGLSVLDSGKLLRAQDQATNDLHKKVNRAVLLPLSSSENLKLSICILPDEAVAKGNRGANRESLCKVLSQYFRPTVFANIVSIWSQWTELHATRTSTAKLCLAVGQEINYGLGDNKQLQDLANDLSDTGQYLTQLDNRNTSDKLEALSVNAIVASAWEVVARSTDDLEMKAPEVRNDCFVTAQRSDLELIFSRLLQWFVYRTKSMPLDVEPVIKIECQSNEGGATITFQDNSHRLPKKLREDLFAPFTQALSTPFPKFKRAKAKIDKSSASTATGNHLNTGRYLPLYLAKMLVEGRYQGVLEDQSDEITEYNYGHRILMQFPRDNN